MLYASGRKFRTHNQYFAGGGRILQTFGTDTLGLPPLTFTPPARIDFTPPARIDFTKAAKITDATFTKASR